MSFAHRKLALQPNDAPAPAVETPDSARRPVAPSSASLVAECLDARHPTLVGRALVRWSQGDECREAWVPTVRGVVVREGDRVLLLQPQGAVEPLIIGIVDGFLRRTEAPSLPGPSVELKADEVLRVVTEAGDALLEITRGAEGPIVRLLQGNTELDLPGALRIRADEIDLRARRGGVQIEATDDVVVRGETIHLN